LAVDLFWIAIGLWLISTADSTIEICYLFNLIFEVISAYGTVGLSLTYANDRSCHVLWPLDQ
jgi:Trk-type K+ transport system membrane component